MKEFISLTHEKISPGSQAEISFLTLNRPNVANAFNKEMISQVINALELVVQNHRTRALVLQGSGKHFSAGADILWMKESVQLTYEENLEEAKHLSLMFETLYHLPLPTIALVHGAAFGGALGLTACCDFAIAAEDAKFSLSEVKLGILPAVILPYLAKKMRPGQLRRLGLTGQVFNGREAEAWGLVELCVAKEALQKTLQTQLEALLSSGPKAAMRLKKLHQFLINHHEEKERAETIEVIAHTRVGKEAAQGFDAFFRKEKPDWSSELK